MRRRLTLRVAGERAATTILLLSLVSLLTDISSEMTLNLLPIYLVGTLGVSVAVVGVIEGIAESAAAFSRLAGGAVSDRVGRRKPFVLAGYGLSAFTKPMFALVTSAGSAGALRFGDRFGKGIRTAPRDALIAEVVTARRRGLAFGLHRAGDTAGALIGVLLAAGALFAAGGGALTRGDFQLVVLLATIPAFAAVLLLTRVRDAPRRAAAIRSAPWWHAPPQGVARRYLLVVFLFALGNASDAFVILRLLDAGASAAEVMLMLALFNGVYAALTVPAGHLSDRVGRRGLLLAGYTAYAVLYAGFALTSSLAALLVLVGLYGAYYGVTDGVGRALVADLAPCGRQGTMFGWYHMLTGLAALPASAVAGTLWTEVGPDAAFAFGSVCAAAAAVGMLRVHPPRVRV